MHKWNSLAMRKLQIGVIGSTKLDMNKDQDKAAWDFAYKVGFALGRTMNIAVLTTGTGGVAEAVTKGVNDAGGIALGILQGIHKEDGTPDSHVNIATTFKGYEYCWPLVYSSDCIIAIGGGTETGIQISLAVDLGLHVVIYSKAGGISNEVFTSLEPTFQKMRSSQLVYLVDDEEEAMDRAKKFAVEREKKELRIEEKEDIKLPVFLEILSDRNQLSIINFLSRRKSMTPQELSDELRLPIVMIQAYLEELDTHEIVLGKRSLGEEYLFSINTEKQQVKKLVEIIKSYDEE